MNENEIKIVEYILNGSQRKYTALNNYITKEGRCKINGLTFYMILHIVSSLINILA